MQAWDERDCGVRAQVEKHSLASNCAYTAVVEMDLECFRTDEFCFAHQEFDAGGFIFCDMNRDQGLNHLALPVSHRRHVSCGGTGVNAEFPGVANKVGNPGTPDLVFARKAIDVGARAPYPSPLQHYGGLS